MNETIGEKIKRLRDEMDLKQVNIHHNQAQVSLIEKGRISNPDETTLRIIAKGLDTTLDNLIEEFPFQKKRFSKYCNGIEKIVLNKL